MMEGNTLHKLASKATFTKTQAGTGFSIPRFMKHYVNNMLFRPSIITGSPNLKKPKVWRSSVSAGGLAEVPRSAPQPVQSPVVARRQPTDSFLSDRPAVSTYRNTTSPGIYFLQPTKNTLPKKRRSA